MNARNATAAISVASINGILPSPHAVYILPSSLIGIRCCGPAKFSALFPSAGRGLTSPECGAMRTHESSWTEHTILDTNVNQVLPHFSDKVSAFRRRATGQENVSLDTMLIGCVVDEGVH